MWTNCSIKLNLYVDKINEMLPFLEGQNVWLLTTFIITTIVLIVIIFLLLNDYLYWCLKIDEINNKIIYIDYKIKNLSIKIDNFRNTISNKKISPPGAYNIVPAAIHQKI